MGIPVEQYVESIEKQIELRQKFLAEKRLSIRIYITDGEDKKNYRAVVCKHYQMYEDIRNGLMRELEECKNSIEQYRNTKNEDALIDCDHIYFADSKCMKRIRCLSFGDAIKALKGGKKVARECWAEGMYLWLLPPATIKAEWCKDDHLRGLAEANGGELECLGSIRMLTADKKVLTGWLASQTDMLLEDWMIIE